MTYVVARTLGDTTCLIADSMATAPDGSQVPLVLKIGILFEGCIFGVSGNSILAIEFLRRAQAAVETASDKWRKFERFAAGYSTYPEKEFRFRVLLSSRHTGTPISYCFDSSTQALEQVGNFASIGSGREIIDAELHAIDRFDSGVNPRVAIEQNIMRPQDFGFAYCGVLNEWANGLDTLQLRNLGVGGTFSFVRQTPNSEEFQESAVYMVIDRRGEENHCILRRVRYVDGCLGIAPLGPERMEQFETNAVVRPDLALPDRSAAAIQELMDHASETVDILVLHGGKVDRQTGVPHFVFWYHPKVGNLTVDELDPAIKGAVNAMYSDDQARSEFAKWAKEAGVVANLE